MSEPVAWMVKSKTGLIRACWSEPPLDVQIQAAEFDGDTIMPLYTAAEMARKDAAIADLRLALERIYTSHYAAPEILRGIARDAIAKYDTSTKGAA